MKKLLIKILNIINTYRESLKYKKLEIPSSEFYRLKNNVNNDNSVLFGKSIKIIDSFWYLFSIKEIFIDGIYKFNTKKNDPLIIDCGANIGLSVIYFKKLFPDSLIIAFEPDPVNFIILKSNLIEFNLHDVEVIPKAVWINEKPLFFKKNGSIGGHLINHECNNSIKIETVCLRNYLNRNIDFLKIDIEGSEYDIIKDCEDLLVNVKNIFVEYHSFPDNPQMIGELLIILRNAGFKTYIKEAWENMKNPYIEQIGGYFDLQLNIFGYRIE